MRRILYVTCALLATGSLCLAHERPGEPNHRFTGDAPQSWSVMHHSDAVHGHANQQASFRLAQDNRVPERGIRPTIRSEDRTWAPNTPTPVAGSKGRSDLAQFEATMWEIIKNSSDPADFEAYLDIFPKGRHSAVARKSLRDLRAKAPAAPPQSTRGTARPGNQMVEPRALEAALQLTRKERALIQRALNGKNHQAGEPDGLFGQRTRGAIWRYQSALGMKRTGYLTDAQAKDLVEFGKSLTPSSERKRSVSTEKSQPPPPVRKALAAPAAPTIVEPRTRSFPAPDYDLGTTFTIRSKDKSRRDKIIVLEYSGKSGDISNFGKFEMSRNFRISRRGVSKPLYMSPIRFPLKLGDSWTYRMDFDTKNGKCTVARTMTATVAEKATELTVSSEKISAIKIIHRGKQRRTCSGRTFDPDTVQREFYYSPMLGMFLLDQLRVVRTDGIAILDRIRELVSYSLPSR